MKMKFQNKLAFLAGMTQKRAAKVYFHLGPLRSGNYVLQKRL